MRNDNEFIFISEGFFKVNVVGSYHLSSLPPIERTAICTPAIPGNQDGRLLERDSVNNKQVAERDRRRARKKYSRLSRHVDVIYMESYMESFRSLKDRLKAAYLCSPELCPEFKKRLEQHQHERHSPGGNMSGEASGNSDMATLGAGRGTSTLSGPDSNRSQRTNKSRDRNNNRYTIENRPPWNYGIHVDKSSTTSALNSLTNTEQGKVGPPKFDINDSNFKTIENKPPGYDTKCDSEYIKTIENKPPGYDTKCDSEYIKTIENKPPGYDTKCNSEYIKTIENKPPGYDTKCDSEYIKTDDLDNQKNTKSGQSAITTVDNYDAGRWNDGKFKNQSTRKNVIGKIGAYNIDLNDINTNTVAERPPWISGKYADKYTTTEDFFDPRKKPKLYPSNLHGQVTASTSNRKAETNTFNNSHKFQSENTGRDYYTNKTSSPFNTDKEILLRNPRNITDSNYNNPKSIANGRYVSNDNNEFNTSGFTANPGIISNIPGRKTYDTMKRSDTLNINASNSNISQIVRSETRSDSDDPIQKAVIQCLQELPMYPIKGNKANEDTKNAINNFVEYLNNMTGEIQDPENEKNIRNEIDKCLEKIPIWYPGAKLDQVAYKTKLFEEIIKRINYNKANMSNKSNAAQIYNKKDTLSPREGTTSTVATTTDDSSIKEDDDYNYHSEKLTSTDQTIIIGNNILKDSKKKPVDKYTSTTTINNKPSLKSGVHVDNYTTTDDFDSLCNLLYGNMAAPNQKNKTNKPIYRNNVQSENVAKYTSTTNIRCPSKSENLNKRLSRKHMSSHIPIPMNRKKSYTIDRPSTPNRSAVKREKSRSLLEAGTENSKEPIHRAVIDWIKEIPMYPVLGKSGKDDTEYVINKLINNINILSRKLANADYEGALRAEIGDCLHKLPIWYPGAKKDQTIFENKLIERLVKKTSSKNTAISSNRRASKTTFDNNGASNLESDAIKNAVMEWLSSIYANKINDSDAVVDNISESANFVMIRLMPIVNNSRKTKNYKMNLKSAIINILNDLPANTKYPKKRNLNVQKFAEYLVNRIISIRSKDRNTRKFTNASTAITNSVSFFSDIQRENEITFEVRKYLKGIDINCPNTVIEEASRILTDFLEMPDPEGEIYAKNEISNLLVTLPTFSAAQSSLVAKKLTSTVVNIIDEDNVNSYIYKKARQPNTMSVYSMDESSPLNYPYTSTPMKKLEKKIVPKLNPQEVQYMNNVAKLVRAWMDTLPKKFDAREEKDFKETMIKDLAGDIMDDAKLEQIYPGARKDKLKYQDYIVARWIHRLGVIDLPEVQPHIEEFLRKLQDIPVPIMTQPQHGNRQAMANIRHYHVDKKFQTFLPGGTDILEDEISIWMNEQPPDVFSNYDQSFRNQQIHVLAQVLGNKLADERSQAVIRNDVEQWLNKIVESREKHNVAELAEDLKDRLIGLPQDATLVANYDKKVKEKAEYLKQNANQLKKNTKFISNTTNNEIQQEQEHTMKMFISKYLDQNYDTDDPLARRAFNQMLKTHLQRLDLPTRKEVYDNFGSDDRFLERKLIQELEYIKIVSDWLKNVPLEPSFNTLGNKERIDFVNSLAINIYEVEEERDNDPNAMDYDSYMWSIILQSLFQLPIPVEYCNSKNYDFMIEQLVRKIRASRENVIYKTNNSMNIDRVEIDYIGDFIENFIRVHGTDIAHDEAKLDAWVVRLIREIKKIVRNSSSPAILSKSHIYNKLTEVSIPGDETIRLFSLEIKYIDEITDWLKNFPLLPINNEGEANYRAGYVCELAEKMVEIDKKKMLDPSDTTTDIIFEEYVTKWISGLLLDNSKDIVMPIVIQQLRNRMEKVSQKRPLPELSTSISNKTLENSPPKYTQWKKSLTKSRKKRRKSQEITGDSVVDVIEKWLNDLPIAAESEKDLNIMRTDIGNQLCQKIIQLNMHPIISNDDLLYRDMLIDEIDIILENLPQNTNLQKNRSDLQSDLVNSIMEARNDIKDKTAGDNYKLKLENKLDASIPNPVSINYIYDPGFEIYKSRLVTMFILENFDHGADAVKDKYEKLLKKEIDKYYEHAKNKNATPISRDEIYNELYSNLFKVPVPNEASIINEVEEIKTRCEVDTWFEALPMRAPYGIIELLEWDKILSALAKRIHAIESSESRYDDKIFKEIMKWLAQLPLQPENEKNLEGYAKNLQNTLKSTVTQRKCVLNDSRSNKRNKGKDKAKTKETTSARKGNSQIAGPSSSGKLEFQKQPRKPKRNAAEEIFEIVQTWCNHIPIPATTPSEEERAQVIKDDLTRKIINKIYELNIKPGISESDTHYYVLLDEELDRLLSAIPTCCNFSDSKEARKHQLKEFIKSVMPFIMEERAFHKYKQNLICTADRILEKPQNMPADKEAAFIEQRNYIVDDFILSKYSRYANESKQIYKTIIQNNVSNIVDDKNNENPNSLIKTNQLICELEKIPIIDGVNVRDTLEEIRMKKEIADFFDGLGLPGKSDKTKMNSLKETLAKKLNELELKFGHTTENESKMKQEITRCLNKLSKEVNPTVIDDFIKTLREGEMVRRTPPVSNEEENVLIVCQKDCRHICQIDATANISHCEESPRRSLERYIDEKPTRTSNIRFEHRYEDTRRNIPIDEDVGGRMTPETNSEDEEMSEEERRRMWQYFSKCRSRMRRPYCMVPMRYVCGGYNPYWLQSMPGFF